MKKHQQIRVTGKVQGVCFRDSTREKAEGLGIKGIVRNEPDGSVYIEAEAAPDKLENFLDWVEHGPSSADVDSISKKPAEPKGYDSFEVQR